MFLSQFIYSFQSRKSLESQTLNWPLISKNGAIFSELATNFMKFYWCPNSAGRARDLSWSDYLGLGCPTTDTSFYGSGLTFRCMWCFAYFSTRSNSELGSGYDFLTLSVWILSWWRSSSFLSACCHLVPRTSYNKGSSTVFSTFHRSQSWCQ